MKMALWQTASPIFLGAFLALVAVIILMGKTHKLLRGPKALAAWINGDGGCRRKYGRKHGRKHGPAARKHDMRRQWKVPRRWKKKPVNATPTPKVYAVPTPAPTAMAL